MCDMGHEDEEEDDDNNNNNDDDDDGDDDDNDGHHVPQQQHTITHEHPRSRWGRGRRPKGQQTRQIQSNKMRDWDAYLEELGTSSHY